MIQSPPMREDRCSTCGTLLFVGLSHPHPRAFFMTTIIKCSFCDADYDADATHICAGNHVPPRYKRSARTPGILAPDEAHGYARELLKEELAKLKDERTAIDLDYEAYKLVHEPMVESLIEALAKI
jgi:hypothetical protein